MTCGHVFLFGFRPPQAAFFHPYFKCPAEVIPPVPEGSTSLSAGASFVKKL